MLFRILVMAAAATATATAFDGPASNELFNYNPVADAAAVHVLGNARFTVLTPALIRCEYAVSGAFEDRATVAILQRKLPVPQFTASVNGNTLTINTGAVQLTYKGPGAFSPDTLTIASMGATTPPFAWTPGMDNSGNLLGTIKSLDELGVITLNCTLNNSTRVHDESLHCAWGLVSRLGWAVLDDSPNWALTEGAEWWDSVNTNQQDWYFFGHGYNYRGALKDFTAIAGQIPMIPRYATGIWWTRWYDVNNVDVRDIVADYQSRTIPLDVFVLDMDWHRKNNWGGFTFDETLFPYAADTLGVLKSQGLHLAANIHDDNGVGNYDAMFPELCAAIGQNPTTTTVVPFTIVNKTVAYAVEDIVMEAVIRQGMDFWWIDYQQGGTQGGAAGGPQNPTVWTDKLRVTDPKRQGKNQRGLILARWGGVGTHRYQVGFSGDVADLSWQNLAFQPYFSVTASNIGYGFWSHDIEGPAGDNEMYLRWIQWASVSSVFRSHDRGMSAGDCYNDVPESCSTVRVWDLPTKYFHSARAAMQHRASLVPYFYGTVRAAFDTGLSPIFPMYYNYPEQPNAYLTDPTGNVSQYFFGDDIIAAPIVAPAGADSMAQATVWVPPGQWYEYDTGALLAGASDGSTVLTKKYDLSEIPRFWRGGAVIPQKAIPLGDTLGLAGRAFTDLTLTIVPGAVAGNGSVYEDDGVSFDYVNGVAAVTTVSYTRTSAAAISVTVTTAGTFTGMPLARAYSVKLLNSLPLASATVTLNGSQQLPVPYARLGGPRTWTYDGQELAVIVELAPTPTLQSLTFDLQFIAAGDDTALSGVKGGLRKALLAKRNLDETRSNLGESTPQGGKLMSAASTSDALAYLAGANATAFLSTLAAFPALFAAAVSEVAGLENVNKQRLAYSVSLLNNAFN